MSLLRAAGSPIVYLFAYFVLPQKYECKGPDGTWAACTAETDICPAREAGLPIEYRVQTEYEYFLENWQ